MMKLMIGNQKGGVAKTTTAMTLARCFADRGYRTLLVDSDPQGSVAVTLRLKPQYYLSDFVLNGLKLEDCVTQVAPNLEVLCGNRETTAMEQRIFTMYGREFVFQKAFGPYEDRYGAIVVDVAPSISLLQACSMVFCGRHHLLGAAHQRGRAHADHAGGVIADHRQPAIRVDRRGDANGRPVGKIVWNSRAGRHSDGPGDRESGPAAPDVGRRGSEGEVARGLQRGRGGVDRDDGRDKGAGRTCRARRSRLRTSRSSRSMIRANWMI